MKELCCKVLAAVFMILIIVSLFQMHRDFHAYEGYIHGSHSFVLTNEINAFDSVLVGPQKYIGIVEQVTNNLYHVVVQDNFQNAIHGIYTKEQLQTVLIVTPHKHE